MGSEIFLEIAGIKVGITSRASLIKEKSPFFIEQGYRDFILNKRPNKLDIEIKVEVNARPSVTTNKELLFRVKNLDYESWLLFKTDKHFLLEKRVNNNYTAIINQYFNRVKIIIPPLKADNNVYSMNQVLGPLGPLQLIFILYLTKNKLGILVHASGIEDHDKGVVFIGPSGSGKTTMAYLWHKKCNVAILSDDRVIIRRLKKGIYLCGTPWSGNGRFNISNKIVKISKLFFIHHYEKINKAIPLQTRQVFNKFFPNVFPPFWDKEGMVFTIDFLFNLLKEVPSYRLDFVKDESIIKYVRKGIF